MAGLRVLIHNVHGFRAGVGRVAAAVVGERPDLALLNEVGRTRGKVRRYCRLLDMEGVSGIGLLRSIPNAVAARPPWRVGEWRTVRLSREGRLIPRGTVLASVRGPGSLTVASVHLGLANRERLRHAREVTDLVSGERGALILGGDLNEGPEGPAVAWMSARLWDAFAGGGEGPGETFPAREPRVRIDYLFVSEGVRVERAWVGGGDPAASDHLPLFADLEVEE